MKILVNSIPKSGTHLAANFVSLVARGKLHRGKNRFIREVSEAPFSRHTVLAALETRMMKAQGIWMAHIFHYAGLENDLARMGVKTFFIYRDPRAVAVSRAHYMTKHHGHFHSEYLRNLPDIHARIEAIITGWGDGQNMDHDNAIDIDTFHRWFLPWERAAIPIQYEQMVSNGKRIAFLMQEVFEHQMDLHNAERVARMALGHKTSTYRCGIIDAWRKDWTARHDEIFNAVAPMLLEDMGYDN